MYMKIAVFGILDVQESRIQEPYYQWSIPGAPVLSAPAQHQLLYFGFSIHQEVASDPFCLLINSSWLLVFILFLFHHALALNLYWWKGIHFS